MPSDSDKFGLHKSPHLTRTQLQRRKNIAYRHGGLLTIATIYGGIAYWYELRTRPRDDKADRRVRILADLGALRQEEAIADPT